MRMAAQSQKRDYMTVLSDSLFPTKMIVSPHALTSRVVRHITEKGWSSDFPPLLSAFSPKWAMAWFSENKAENFRALSSANAIERSSMAFMLRSHNGVHCCGTVGDSHPVHYVDHFSPQQSASKLAFAFGLRKRSQLSTAKCTFTDDSFQNHDAKLLLFHESSRVFLIFFRNMWLTW